MNNFIDLPIKTDDFRLRRNQRLSKCLGGCEDLRRGAAALQDGRDLASGSATGFPMGVPLKGPRSEHGENWCFTAGWGPQDSVQVP
jgi:hypothetical protein